ncbi:unnamed protein product [Durusdinium trenchii]|uniref:RRM domain-containing protein n=1 Tax=Durusdinium trenchii TaxID=1381693 RepID=A0ABP0K5W5_9DINO
MRTEHLFHADRSSTFSPELVKTLSGHQAPVPVHLSYGTGALGIKRRREEEGRGNQSFIIVEDAQLPRQRGWDGICGLGWKGIAQLEKPLYERLQDQGRKAIFSFVPEGTSSAHMVLGQVPHYAVKPGHDGRSFWVARGGIAVHKQTPHKARFLVDTGTNQVLLAPRHLYMSIMRSVLPQEKFNELCGIDEMAGGAVFCDCSIVAHSHDLPPLKIFLADRAFELPIGEMFSRIPTKDGRGEACLLAVQPNNLNVEASGSMPMPLPFGGLGGLLPKMPGFNLPFDLPDLLGGGLPGFGHSGSGLGHGPSPAASGLSAPGPSASGAASSPFGAGFPGFDEKFPGFDGKPFGLGIGKLGKGVLSEQVREEIRTRPDGTVCKYITVTENGHVKSRCSGILEIPLDPAGEEEPADDDLWILGGMFLERFVVSFDFDQGRMGFAEPVGKTQDLDTIGMALRLRGMASETRWQEQLGVLLCSLLVSVVYATVRVKRMAREEHLVEHMRVEVAEEECLGALNQWWIPQSKLHTQFDQVFSDCSKKEEQGRAGSLADVHSSLLMNIVSDVVECGELVDRKVLEEAFVRFGELKTVEIPLDLKTGKSGHRGFGFVEFMELDDAQVTADAIDNMHHAELYGRVPLGCGDGERESIGALRIGACIGAVRGCGVAACVGMTYEASLRAEMRIDETYMDQSESGQSPQEHSDHRVQQAFGDPVERPIWADDFFYRKKLKERFSSSDVEVIMSAPVTTERCCAAELFLLGSQMARGSLGPLLLATVAPVPRSDWAACHGSSEWSSFRARVVAKDVELHTDPQLVKKLGVGRRGLNSPLTWGNGNQKKASNFALAEIASPPETARALIKRWRIPAQQWLSMLSGSKITTEGVQVSHNCGVSVDVSRGVLANDTKGGFHPYHLLTLPKDDKVWEKEDFVRWKRDFCYLGYVVALYIRAGSLASAQTSSTSDASADLMLASQMLGSCREMDFLDRETWGLLSLDLDVNLLRVGVTDPPLPSSGARPPEMSRSFRAWRGMAEDLPSEYQNARQNLWHALSLSSHFRRAVEKKVALGFATGALTSYANSPRPVVRGRPVEVALFAMPVWYVTEFVAGLLLWRFPALAMQIWAAPLGGYNLPRSHELRPLVEPFLLEAPELRPLELIDGYCCDWQRVTFEVVRGALKQLATRLKTSSVLVCGGPLWVCLILHQAEPTLPLLAHCLTFQDLDLPLEFPENVRWVHEQVLRTFGKFGNGKAFLIQDDMQRVYYSMAFDFSMQNNFTSTGQISFFQMPYIQVRYSQRRAQELLFVREGTTKRWTNSLRGHLWRQVGRARNAE